MSSTFPRARVFSYGYQIEEVDEFLDRARSAYERPGDVPPMTAADIRTAAFSVKRRGYSTEAVDAALERLEEAFERRGRDEYIRANGQQAWMSKLGERAQTLYPRLRRPEGERFSHPAKGHGYDIEEVDAILDRLTAFFERGQALTAQEVRTAQFSSKSGKKAYDERPVDAYLARAVEVLVGAS